MKIIITGIAGFIGSHILDLAMSEGNDVMGIDNLSTGKVENVIGLKYVLRSYDIAMQESICNTVDKFRPDVICHQAAQPSLRTSIEQPARDALTNIIGTLNVIESARRVGARLVFASTSAVYDSNGYVPYSENDCLRPNLPYGISKMAAENYIRNSGLSYAVLRYANIYGPRQVRVGENQLVPHCLDHIFKGDQFVVNGDGEQTRDFVYVKDIARANLLAMQSGESGTFNCGSGTMVSVNEVCNTLKEFTGWQGTFEHGPYKVGEMRHSGLNSKLAKATLGWQAETSLMDGLKATIDWYKSK